MITTREKGWRGHRCWDALFVRLTVIPVVGDTAMRLRNYIIMKAVLAAASMIQSPYLLIDDGDVHGR